MGTTGDGGEMQAPPAAGRDTGGGATCASNEGYPASLVEGKAYQVLPDAAAEAIGLLRVVDESGEDYLYPAGSFVRNGGASREG